MTDIETLRYTIVHGARSSARDSGWWRLGQVVNVLVGLSTALLGYLVGRLWQTVVVRHRCRRARNFWRSAVDEKFQIVVSRFTPEGHREPTGVVGGGDAIADRILRDHFGEIGFKRPTVVFVDEPKLDRRNNLILLGGPDSNRVTHEALQNVPARLRVVNPGPGQPMQVEDWGMDDSKDAPSVFVAEPATAAMTDYGVIARVRNPFNPSRTLVMISGAYGYGTWAGVELSRTDDFLRRCEALDSEHRAAAGLVGAMRSAAGRWVRRSARPDPGSRWAEFECLLRVEVYDREPQRTEILRFRPIRQTS